MLMMFYFSDQEKERRRLMALEEHNARLGGVNLSAEKAAIAAIEQKAEEEDILADDMAPRSSYVGRYASFDAAQAKAESVSFFDELGKQAEEKIGKPLAAVGEGVSRSVTLAGNLLPITLIAVAVLIALPYIRRATSTTT